MECAELQWHRLKDQRKSPPYLQVQVTEVVRYVECSNGWLLTKYGSKELDLDHVIRIRR